jgi:hypothetical protein
MSISYGPPKHRFGFFEFVNLDINNSQGISIFSSTLNSFPAFFCSGIKLKNEKIS